MEIKTRKVKELKHTENKNCKKKAHEYGYDKDYSKKIAGARSIKQKSKEPVAKDTNKTRRKMVNPAKRSAFAS